MTQPGFHDAPARTWRPVIPVSFVIPCYQEEESLADFAEHLAQVPGDEIVFVDDGSRDGTAAALAELASRDERVRIETHERNRGVGAAMRTGFDAARGDIVVVYDVDRTYPLDDARKLIDAVANGACDVASATPFAHGGGLERVPVFRRLLSRGAVCAYRVVLAGRTQGMTTYTCAFRAYRASQLETLRFASDGFPAAAEIIGRLLLRRARVVEVPSTLRARTEGSSKMRVGRTLLGHLWNCARLLWIRVTPSRA